MASSKPSVLSRRCVVFDLDGVIWAGDHAIPGAVETLARLQAAGKQIAFLTNNSSKLPEKIWQKLIGFGVQCSLEDVITSGVATARFIGRMGLKSGAGVFVIGTPDFKELVQKTRVLPMDPTVCEAVVVGYDPAMTYKEIADGLTALNRGVPFIVCNREASFPGNNGKLLPGCGAMVGALSEAAQRQPDYIVGKPNTIMLDLLLDQLTMTKDEIVLVGDSLESDIAMANVAGVPSVWVTGSREERGIQQPGNRPHPDVTVKHLPDLLTYI